MSSNNVICATSKGSDQLCAYAQSDQSICSSLEYSITVKLQKGYLWSLLKPKYESYFSPIIINGLLEQCPECKILATITIVTENGRQYGLKILDQIGGYEMHFLFCLCSMLISLSKVSFILNRHFPIFSPFCGHICYHGNDKSQINTRLLHLGLIQINWFKSNFYCLTLYGSQKSHLNARSSFN